MKKCANPRCDNKEDPRWGGFCDGCAPDPAITFIIRSAAYAKGRADERAANRIERGDHEVKKPDQCMDCGAFIVGAHGCQGRPGDEES